MRRANRERERVDRLLDKAVLAEHRVEQAKQRHQQLEDQCNAKRRELRALEREGVEGQDERDRVAAELADLRLQAKAAREQREADEALGSRGLAGSRARRGREQRAAHAAEVAALTTERDEARAALEKSRDDGALGWREVLRVTKRAETAERERDELQVLVPDPQQEEDRLQQWSEMSAREVRSARFLGVEDGLRIAGDALERCVEESGHLEPGMKRLLEALEALKAQNVATVGKLALGRGDAPQRAWALSGRSGAFRRAGVVKARVAGRRAPSFSLRWVACRFFRTGR